VTPLPLPAKAAQLEVRSCHFVAAPYRREPAQWPAFGLSRSVSPAILAGLGDLGLVPDVQVAVAGEQPFGGPLLVEVAGAERALGEKAGRQVRVRMLTSGLDK
jgi:Fe2+ transport system protein FeoA